MSAVDEDLRYGIDRLAVRDSRVFGWGWIVHRSRPIESVALVLEGDDGRSELPGNYGLARDDVRQAHPELSDAPTCGFVATGYARCGIPRRVVLEARYADGDSVTLDVSGAVDPRAWRKLRALAWIVRAVGRRARLGDWRGILARARAQNYLAPSLDDEAVSRSLRAEIGNGEPVTLIFDHNMGGGANFYREQAIDERLAAGRAVLLCTYNLPTLDYRLALRRNSADDRLYRLSSFLVIDALIEGVDEIFVNSPVSFDEPLVFAEWLASARERHPSTKLVVTMHDYFAVCPSYMLVNADGRYCGIPALSQCEDCIKRHRASYVALSPPTAIAPWRAIWGRCLAAADEVRCFSESTRTLLLRAYPALDRARIAVIPHRIDPGVRRPTIDPAGPLTIGVIGQISEQKGARVVSDIVRRLDREKRDARVVVIGTLDRRVVSERLRVTGPYRRDELVDLIEAHGVNIVLFPTIGAETFSYVVEEAMHLRMPIVAFNLGAPPERLRRYADARLCGTVSADAALETLDAFHRELATRARNERERNPSGVC